MSERRLIPLSSVQRGVWLDQTLHGRTVNMGGGLRIDGPVDANALRDALQVLVDRNDALRMVLRKGDDLPVQEFLPSMPVRLQRVDLRDGTDADAEEWMRKEMAVSFPLVDAPCFHYALVTVAGDRHFWFHKYNHLVMDGHGNSLMSQRLAAIYTNIVRGLPLDDEPLYSYGDFVQDDLAYFASERHDEDIRYWRDKFAELPAPVFPQKAAGDDVHARRAILMLQRPFYDRIAPVAAAYDASTFHLFLAAVYIYFCRTGRRDDLCIGTATVNRPSAAFKKTIGLFTGATPSLFRFGRDLTAGELMQAIGRELRRDYRHLRLPLFEISHAAGLHRQGRALLADVGVTYQKQTYDVRFDGHPTELISISHGAERTPLVLEICEYNDQLDVRVNIDYHAGDFPDDAIDRFKSRFVHVVDQILAHPDAPIRELSLVPPAERRRLIVDFNANVIRFPPDATIIDRFEAQVLAHPDQTALIFEEKRVTYAEMNARVNRLARHLRTHGAGAGSIVAICLERSEELIIAVFAALKTGAAYLPLDPFHPPERLAFMLRDCGADTLVTQRGLLPELHALEGLTAICIDREAADIALQPATDLAVPILPEHLAYVIYTSGSTGRPKGARLTHHNAVRMCSATNEIYDFDERDVWPLFHSIAFDFTVWEMFGALLRGGTLVVVPHWVTRDPVDFYRLVSARGITVLGQTPSAFAQFIRADQSFTPPLPLAVREIILAGESLNVSMLEPWFERYGDQRPRINNMYGITETSVATSWKPVSLADLGETRSLIGRTLCDIPAYVLDERLQPVPLGVPGELCTGGDAVGAGYINQPELEAARFVRDPFRDVAGARLYRTGDLVRQLSDGSLEYLGRIDDQVKVRGFRIELGEITAALDMHPAVRESVVVVRGGQLVAYIVPAEDAQLPLAELRAHLRRTLPEPMIPSAFVRMSEFPLNANAKIDRQALPAPAADPIASAAYVEPQRQIEKTIAGVWKEVLDVERVGLHDNFFDLGGHSLHMVRARARLEEVLRINLAMADLFACPTIHALADFIGGSGLTPAEKSAPPRRRRVRNAAAARARGPE